MSPWPVCRPLTWLRTQPVLAHQPQNPHFRGADALVTQARPHLAIDLARGGKASKRGLSDEQVPVLVVADRSGATVSAVLPAVNADTLRAVIKPIVDEGIVLVTDGHRACPRCAAAIGAHHEALNLSRSERMRGAFHIQTVNNRHGRLKDFPRRYRGVATRYLDNYLRWFQRLELENASPRACLATAIARLCIQFETAPSGLICSPVPFPSTLTRLPPLSSRPKGAKLQADGGTFECRLTLKRISNSPTRAIETFQTSRTTAIRFLAKDHNNFYSITLGGAFRACQPDAPCLKPTHHLVSPGSSVGRACD